MKFSKEINIDSKANKKLLVEGINNINISDGWTCAFFKDNSEIGRMRRGFHGVWLPYLAEQANLTHGILYSTKVWKVHLRRMFLWEESTTLPNGKEEIELISTEDLKVNQYAEFMDSVAIFCLEEFEITLPDLDPTKRNSKYE